MMQVNSMTCFEAWTCAHCGAEVPANVPHGNLECDRPYPALAPTVQETARLEEFTVTRGWLKRLADLVDYRGEGPDLQAALLMIEHAMECCGGTQLAERKPAGEPSEEWWDQHSVQCGNCSVEILTRKGSIPENTGLSDTGGSEDESLCGRCAGTQMYAYMDQLNAPSPSLEALPLDAWEEGFGGMSDDDFPRIQVSLVRQLIARVRAQEAELVELRKDRERLDEIQRRGLSLDHRGGVSKSVDPWMVREATSLHKAVTYWTGKTVREAIDAATKEGKK